MSRPLETWCVPLPLFQDGQLTLMCMVAMVARVVLIGLVGHPASVAAPPDLSLQGPIGLQNN